MSDTYPDSGVGVPELAVRVGITYRQLFYWIEQDYVTCIGNPRPGSGGRTWLSPHEADVVAVMAQLVAAGLRAAKAAGLARVLIDDGTVDIEGGGLMLVLAPSRRRGRVSAAS